MLARVRCEACESAEATERVEDAPGTTTVFSVCAPCASRLVGRALRPREWLRLAARHGPFAHALHEDFYDEHGRARRPQIPVTEAEAHAYPSPEEWRRSAALAFEIALSRWPPDPEALAVLGQDPVGTVARLWAVASPVALAHAPALAAAIGPPAAEWVRAQWDAGADLGVITWASAACLPADESYERARAALEAERPPAAMSWWALEPLHDRRVLGLIERHAASPVSDSVGRLAAVSRIEWPRIVRWLALGRPLSLVALDALRTLVAADTPFTRAVAAKLEEPPTRAELEHVLDAALRADDVPRVQRIVARVRERAAKLARD
jgi:hypothetical protein